MAVPLCRALLGGATARPAARFAGQFLRGFFAPAERVVENHAIGFVTVTSFPRWDTQLADHVNIMQMKAAPGLLLRLPSGCLASTDLTQQQHLLNRARLHGRVQILETLEMAHKNAEEEANAVLASSVLKKRRRRMNHHKHKKWMKKMKYRLKSEGRK